MAEKFAFLVSFVGIIFHSVLLIRAENDAKLSGARSVEAPSWSLLPTGVEAVAVLEGPDPFVGRGIVVFTEAELAGEYVVVVSVTVVGLLPGKHGFHIHEFGDLTQGCDSAGAHYNPLNKTHGGLTGEDRHAGDMGNIVADLNGIAIRNGIVVKDISLSASNSIIGRSAVVHEDEDDLGLGDTPDSSTTGNSQARLSCGVIGFRSS